MNIVKTRNELLLGKTIFDMNLNVGYYARVSTDKDEQFTSYEAQLDYYTNFIKSHPNKTTKSKTQLNSLTQKKEMLDNNLLLKAIIS